MRRITTTVAVVAVALACCAGCLPQPPTLAPLLPAPTDTTTSTVVVFGDSLGAFAERPTKTLFAATPATSVSYNAVAGTEAPDWTAAMANVPAGACVLWELGTNDLSKNLIAVAIEQLHAGLATLDAAGAGPVVAMTFNTTSGDGRGFPFDIRTRLYNDELRKLAADGRIVLYEWDAESMGHPEWLVDGLHYTAAAVPIYAAALVAAAGMCTP